MILEFFSGFYPRVKHDPNSHKISKMCSFLQEFHKDQCISYFNKI